MSGGGCRRRGSVRDRRTVNAPRRSRLRLAGRRRVHWTREWWADGVVVGVENLGLKRFVGGRVIGERVEGEVAIRSGVDGDALDELLGDGFEVDGAEDATV